MGGTKKTIAAGAACAVAAGLWLTVSAAAQPPGRHQTLGGVSVLDRHQSSLSDGSRPGAGFSAVLPDSSDSSGFSSPTGV